MIKPSLRLSFLSKILLLSTICIYHTLVFGCKEPSSCDEKFGEVDENWNFDQLCRDMEYTDMWDDIVSEEECRMYQSVYHLCFFCAGEEDGFCAFAQGCPSRPLSEDTNVTDVCAELEILLEQRIPPSTTETCILAEEVSFACPIFCEVLLDDNLANYLGTDTEAKKKALVWTARVNGILSFLGATFILVDILRDRNKHSNVLHQLLVGMAMFDLCTGGAWAFASAPLPKDEAFYVYGSRGTSASCTAQGFFIQLGFTSVFYNMSLALQYFLVITRRWREPDLKKIRIYLHAFPLVIGFGLAFGAIPEYNWLEYGCHLETTPEGELWEVLLFVVVPIGSAILVITGLMLAIFIKVHRQAQASRKWRFGIGKDSSMEREVFWQCFFYVLAFYVTWPHVFAVYIGHVDIQNYPAAYLFAFLAPLQGFNNFLVYVRLRIVLNARALAERASAQSALSFGRLFPSLPERHQSGGPEEPASMPAKQDDNNAT